MTVHMDFAEQATDTRTLRNALGRYATGVTIVTTRAPNGTSLGLTCNSFASVSLDPPLVLWSLRRESPSLPSFVEAGRFTVNVLGADQSDLCARFARDGNDKFAGLETQACALGSPLVPGSLAVFSCTTHATIDGGDHVIFIGRVRQARIGEGEPLVFAAGRLGRFAPFG